VLSLANDWRLSTLLPDGDPFLLEEAVRIPHPCPESISSVTLLVTIFGRVDDNLKRRRGKKHREPAPSLAGRCHAKEKDMNQSFTRKTSAQWVVTCLLVLLLAVSVTGLAHTSYNEHGPKVVPLCNGCDIHQNHLVAPSGIDIPRVYLVSPAALPAKKR
jgi:hypothetical protein